MDTETRTLLLRFLRALVRSKLPQAVKTGSAEALPRKLAKHSLATAMEGV